MGLFSQNRKKRPCLFSERDQGETEYMEYLQVNVYTTTLGVEPVGALLLELGVGGYAVRDAADFEEFLAGKSGHWDYIEDELMALRHTETTLTVYLAQNQQGAEGLRLVKEGLERLKELDTHGKWGRLSYSLENVKEEDWAETWKQYYHPLAAGPLTVCPSWEDYDAAPGEVVLRMDPGMAFGTGTHESTRLCLELLGESLRQGMQVLDIGCGSGILAIASLLLGAGSAVGVDIDQVAVRTSEENARRNGVENRASFHCGSLAGQVSGAYDIVVANIVADVIIGFVPDVPRLLRRGGVFIVSGIIDTREDEVAAALEAGGFTVTDRKTAGGWVAMACTPG